MKSVIPFLFLLVFLFSGCDLDDEQADFWTEALAEPSDFTETTAEGSIVSEDPDDWRISPVYRGMATIEPAYPNPNAGQTVIINISHSVSQGGPQRLKVAVVEEARFSVIDELPDTAAPSFYQLSFNPSAELGDAGLYRFLLLDDRDELISYGDIMVE